MNIKNYIITTLLSLTPFLLSAQELTVQSFTLSPTEIIPANDLRNDLNGMACALVKVQVIDNIDRVEGNFIGDIIKRGTEKWVFLTNGTKEFRLYPTNHLPLSIVCKEYDIDGLESKRVYILRLTSSQAMITPEFPKQEQKDSVRIKESVYTMYLDCPPPSYDETVTQANSTWNNGSTIYLLFGNTTGTATYNASNDSWKVTTSTSLGLTNTEQTCTAYYFENESSVNYNTVNLSENAISYQGTASYTHPSTADIYVKVSLKPLTWRMRFTGSSGKNVFIAGSKTDIAYYTAFNCSNGNFTSQTKDVNLTVGSSGYTPYIYGSFANSNNNMLTITTDNENEYSRTVKAGNLKAGESGIITLPTANNHSGWTPKKTFTVGGISFKMILVNGGTFTMGATEEQGNDYYGNETPTHSVTLDSYYIGETEVTQELWQAVMGSNPSYFNDSKRPVEEVSWNDCHKFITKLNAATGQNFRLPTEAEWEFAARGGTQSKGYKYSGSNTIDDVAWYYYNSSSQTHEVAQKSPNELGLYDMSGNVWEWCYDLYGGYSSNSQTNPTGPSNGDSRVCRGGGWLIIARNCRVSERYDNAPSFRYDFIGLRLAL